MSEALLTVIITLRAATHYDMVSRLRSRQLDTDMPDTVRFLVVDDGSDGNSALQIAKICSELGFEYHRHDSGKLRFCASSARNVGAMAARTPYILHEDVDLFPYPGYYRDLINEIEIQHLSECWRRFITVPCLYLSEAATDLALAGATTKASLLHSYLTGSGMVVSALPASSVILVNRYYYLSIGGYNERFMGWGLEDLEFAYRLTRGLNQFISPKEPNWLAEANFPHATAYRGWRAQFRLHGELLLRKGIVALHAHHPKDTSWRNLRSHARNKEIFAEETQAFEANGHALPSLPALEFGKSLIFGRGTFAYNRSLLPLWGQLEVKDYATFENVSVVDYCQENQINRVIFTNPYANDQRTKVYNAVRSANIPFVVVERGALPDSMFIDETGFCCESTRYRREHWPKNLDGGRLRRVQEYMDSVMASGAALERQGKRLGRRLARHQLGIPESKKVLFVPFQSRSDTTVNHFAGAIGSFDNFVSLVREVTQKLPSDWTLIFKNHPLSAVREVVAGAIDIGDMHINDALDVADYTLLMNSGVGVLSAMFSKPVIHTAQAFYSDAGLNRPAATADEVLNILSQGFRVDDDARLRFFSYLLEDFYSFGTFTVREKKHSDQASLTITENIDYYRVNLAGTRIFDDEPDGRITNTKAPVYDIFREWITQNQYSETTAATNPLPAYREPFVFVVRPFVAMMGSKKDLRSYDNDPCSFFSKLTNPIYRRIGRLLFPPADACPKKSRRMTVE